MAMTHRERAQLRIKHRELIIEIFICHRALTRFGLYGMPYEPMTKLLSEAYQKMPLQWGGR